MEPKIILNILKWPVAFLIFAIIFLFFFRNEIKKFIREIGWLKTKWFELKRIQKEVFAKTEEVKEIWKKVNQDKKELKEATKIFTETLYLTLETRNRFPIPSEISKKIVNNLNILATFAIENEEEAKKWSKETQDFLRKNI